MHKPLDPIHPGYARKLLSSGKAAVFRNYPFTIILKREVHDLLTHPLRLKLDPGSKTTGIAIVGDASGEVVFAAELEHRGNAIKAALQRRRAVRGSRRQRKTRYRKPRFANRRRKAGWLPPSLESRLANILTWVARFARLCPTTTLSQELVKFDTQAMQDPDVSGIEYQQGTLFGYEVREYLLQKWNRKCAYCGVTGVPLEVEHIRARANGGTDRVSNLCLACTPCNQRKGKQDIRAFLHDRPEVLARVLAQAKAPLTDASAVNATRWALYERLKARGLPLEVGTGGMTKYNRSTRGLEKTHWVDAACVGKSTPDTLVLDRVKPLFIKATGYGNRQMCLMDRYGFPRTNAKSAKVVYGFQTGDVVKAVVPSGKKQGVHVGRVAVRATGRFNIMTQAHGTVQGIGFQYCTSIHHSDGYSYALT